MSTQVAIKFQSEFEKKLWARTLIAAIRAGGHDPIPIDGADAVVRAYRERHDPKLVKDMAAGLELGT